MRPADSTIESPRKFIGKYAAKSIDDIEISRMSSPRHVWEREATHMRKDSNEAFLLTLMESGIGHLSQSGRFTQVNNGDIALYDAERRFTYDVTPESVLLRIPRKQLLYRAPGRALHGGALHAGQAITGLLASMLREAASANFTEDLPAGVQKQFAASLLDLLAATIQVQMAGCDPEADERERRLQRVKQYIESQLDDPLLTVDRIASALNMSERTLTRLFAQRQHAHALGLATASRGRVLRVEGGPGAAGDRSGVPQWLQRRRALQPALQAQLRPFAEGSAEPPEALNGVERHRPQSRPRAWNGPRAGLFHCLGPPQDEKRSSRGSKRAWCAAHVCMICPWRPQSSAVAATSKKSCSERLSLHAGKHLGISVCSRRGRANCTDWENGMNHDDLHYMGMREIGLPSGWRAFLGSRHRTPIRTHRPA